MLKSSRLVLVLSVAGSLVGATLLPTEHLHGSDETHPTATVHRHFVLGDHDAADQGAERQFEHDDSHVVWLTTAWLHQHAVQLDQPALAATAIVSAPPDATQAIKLRFDESAPPHGPPRDCLRLRAPPSFPA